MDLTEIRSRRCIMKIQEDEAYRDLIKTLKFIFTVQWAQQCETFSIREKGTDGLTDLRQFAYEIEIVKSRIKGIQKPKE